MKCFVYSSVDKGLCRLSERVEGETGLQRDREGKISNVRWSVASVGVLGV